MDSHKKMSEMPASYLLRSTEKKVHYVSYEKRNWNIHYISNGVK